MDTQFETLEPSKDNYQERNIRIAQANGRFYNSFLDAYLENGLQKNKTPQIESLTDSLPPPMRKLYLEGVKRFEEELAANHELLQQNRGNEVNYLLSTIIRSYGKIESEEKILDYATPDKARFVEPAPGVAIIETEKDFFRFLQEQGLIIAEGGATCFQSDNRAEPSFMVVQRMFLEKSLAEEDVSPSQKLSLRHEFHHFIWNFLERSKFVRDVSESSPQLAKSFKHFRDELSAYIIEKRALSEIEPTSLVYTNDKDILAKTSDTRNFACICMKVAERMGIEPETFLYAAMKSRNYNELKNNFAGLTPLQSQADRNTLDVVYHGLRDITQGLVHRDPSPFEKSLAELMKKKGVNFSQEVIAQYSLDRLASSDLTTVSNLYFEGGRIRKFLGVIGAKASTVEETLKKVLSSRLSLPDETTQIILELPPDLKGNMPLDVNTEEFMKKFISFWRVNDESVRTAYSKVLDSSPVLRETFEKVKSEIIERGAREYRLEMRSPERQQKTESETQERTNWILSL